MALPILADAPNQATPGMRNHLMIVLNAIHQTMTGLTIAPLKAAGVYQALVDLIPGAMAITGDPTQPLSAILDHSQKVMAPGAEALAPTSTAAPTLIPSEIPIDPQMVQFPPGSVGAMHAF